MEKLIAFLGIYFYGDPIPMPFMHMADSPLTGERKKRKSNP